MAKDALDFVGNTLDSLSPLFATVVETPPALATLVAVMLLVTEGVSAMTTEFDAVILEFIAVTLEFVCVKVVDNGNEGDVDAEVLTPDWRNWKNSMAASRLCGGNICKRIDIGITRQYNLYDF